MEGETQVRAGASFADLLRAGRERAGLTQEELAERAGLTTYGVSALERGVRTRPYPHTVRALAQARRCSGEPRSSPSSSPRCARAAGC